MNIIEARLVTVCDHCFRASCWHGISMCYTAREAGTIEKPVRELMSLHREHPMYWFKNPNTGALDEQSWADYEAL